MNPFTLFIYTMLVTCFLAPCNGFCHGADGYVDAACGQCVTAFYDDGEPMGYSAVEIKAPGSDVAFQTGRTDRNGCFVVKPDVAGNWQAVVSDGVGHRIVLDFTVAADPENAGPVQGTSVQRAAARPVSRPMGIAAGLSIIFGIAGVAYGWRARRKDSV